MKPCQRCGKAIGPATTTCDHCGSEQRATVGLDAPEPVQPRTGQSSAEEAAGVHQDTFVRVMGVAATAAVCFAAVALGLVSPDSALAIAVVVGASLSATVFFGS